MTLPPEVAKTIQALDKKIKALEEMKRRLMETFAEPSPAHAHGEDNGNKGLTQPPTRQAPTGLTPPSQSPVMLSSAEKLVMFLRNHGPATRKEIVERSGVPDGSISYLLKNGRFRQRQEDQKWEVLP